MDLSPILTVAARELPMTYLTMRYEHISRFPCRAGWNRLGVRRACLQATLNCTSLHSSANDRVVHQQPLEETQ